MLQNSFRHNKTLSLTRPRRRWIGISVAVAMASTYLVTMGGPANAAETALTEVTISGHVIQVFNVDVIESKTQVTRGVKLCSTDNSINAPGDGNCIRVNVIYKKDGNRIEKIVSSTTATFLGDTVKVGDDLTLDGAQDTFIPDQDPDVRSRVSLDDTAMAVERGVLDNGSFGGSAFFRFTLPKECNKPDGTKVTKTIVEANTTGGRWSSARLLSEKITEADAIATSQKSNAKWTAGATAVMGVAAICAGMSFVTNKYADAKRPGIPAQGAGFGWWTFLAVFAGFVAGALNLAGGWTDATRNYYNKVSAAASLFEQLWPELFIDMGAAGSRF